MPGPVWPFLYRYIYICPISQYYWEIFRIHMVLEPPNAKPFQSEHLSTATVHQCCRIVWRRHFDLHVPLLCQPLQPCFSPVLLSPSHSSSSTIRSSVLRCSGSPPCAAATCPHAAKADSLYWEDFKFRYCLFSFWCKQRKCARTTFSSPAIFY